MLGQMKKTDGQWEGTFRIQRTEDGNIVFLFSLPEATMMPETVPGMQGEDSGIQGNLPDVQGKVSRVPGVSPEVQGTVPGIAGVFSGMQGKVSGVPGVSSEVQGIAPGIAGVFPGMQGKVSGVPGVLPEVQGIMSGIAGVFPGVQGRMQEIPVAPPWVPVILPGTLMAAQAAPMAAPEQDTVLFSEYAEKWLENMRCQVKESTYIKYRNQLDSYIIPELGWREWGELGMDAVEHFCDSLLSSGGKRKEGLSPKTVADIMSVVRSIFRYASEHGAAETFDISKVTVKRKKKKIKVLNGEQQGQLYRYLVKNPTSRDLGILICLLMGLRLGEVCALKWKDISFPEGTLSVHQTMQRVQTKDGSGKKTKIIITSPKSASSIRVIPIPKELLKILAACREDPDSYILSGSAERFVEPRAMERYFDKVLKALKIEHVNFHALRHTFATRCVEMGFDVKSLSVILGHSNVNITLNLYVHPTMEMKRRNMQKLSEFMAGG